MNGATKPRQRGIAAQSESTRQPRLTNTISPLVDPVEQMFGTFAEIDRRVTAWVSQNREAIAGAERFVASIVEIDRTIQNRLAKTITPMLEPIEQMFKVYDEINKRIAGWVSENSEAIARFAEAMAKASKRFKEMLNRSDHIARLGWTFPADLPLVDLLHLSQLTNRADADAYVLKWYEDNDPQLEAMEQRLRKNPRLSSFSIILPQCLAAIRRTDYAISIPCIMAILEETVTQLNPPHLLTSTDVKKTLGKGGKVAKQAEKDMVATAIWLSLMTFMNNLYEHCPAVDGSNVSALSRHAILHGRKEPPNDNIEAIRLLHALETALSLHQEIGGQLVNPASMAPEVHAQTR